MENLKKLIREVPDFPKPGINFYDITTLLKDPTGLEETIDSLTEQCRGMDIDTVIGVESRGFISRRRLRTNSEPGLFPFENPKSSRPNACPFLTILNTARTRSKCTRTRSAKDTGS